MAFTAIKRNKLLRLVALPLVEKYQLKRYMRRAELREVPEILQVEPTEACNLKCVMCFRGKGDFDAGPMDFSLYEKIIDQAAGAGVRTLRLYFRGESLLHPRIADMAEYAVGKGIPRVELNTNGQLLTRELSEKLIRSGLHRIFFFG